jgi:cytochrome c-type biogenesis protein CcmH
MRALVATLALLCAVAGAGAALAGGRPSPSDLEDEVMCPVCNTTLDQSDAPVAQQMRRFIRQRIAAGDSKGEIKAKLVDEFGESVLAAPPKRGFGLLAWLLPLIGLAVAVPVVGVLAWRWSRGRGERDDGDPLDPELERRLDDELARFESA